MAGTAAVIRYSQVENGGRVERVQDTISDNAAAVTLYWHFKHDQTTQQQFEARYEEATGRYDPGTADNIYSDISELGDTLVSIVDTGTENTSFTQMVYLRSINADLEKFDDTLQRYQFVPDQADPRFADKLPPLDKAIFVLEMSAIGNSLTGFGKQFAAGQDYLVKTEMIKDAAEAAEIPDFAEFEQAVLQSDITAVNALKLDWEVDYITLKNGIGHDPAQADKIVKASDAATSAVELFNAQVEAEQLRQALNRNNLSPPAASPIYLQISI